MFPISLSHIWIIIFASSIFLYIFKCITNEKLNSCYESNLVDEPKDKIIAKSQNDGSNNNKKQPETQRKSKGNPEIIAMDSAPDSVETSSAFRPRSTQEEFLSKNLMSVIPAPGD